MAKLTLTTDDGEVMETWEFTSEDVPDLNERAFTGSDVYLSDFWNQLRLAFLTEEKEQNKGGAK